MSIIVHHTHKKAIYVKYLGPTNTKGSRMKAYDGDGNSVTVSRNHALCRDDSTSAAAVALCEKMGWDGKLTEGGGDGRNYAAVFVFTE